MAGMTRQDERLDRWWTPPQLAMLWKCSGKTARLRLLAIDQQRGGTLLVGDRTRSKHVKVWGRSLEAAVPGLLSQVVGNTPTANLSEVRQLFARLGEAEERLDEMEPKLHRLAV